MGCVELHELFSVVLKLEKWSRVIVMMLWRIKDCVKEEKSGSGSFSSDA